MFQNKNPQKSLHMINFEPIVLIAPKRSAKIAVYKSTHNLCKLVKRSSLSSQKCSHVIGDVTCMVPLTV